MDTDKMREEFEGAFVEEQVRLLGEGFRSSAICMISQNVITVRSAWWAWQASRAAVVVALPSAEENGTLTRGVIIDVLGVVRSNIEAQDLRVCP